MGLPACRAFWADGEDAVKMGTARGRGALRVRAEAARPAEINPGALSPERCGQSEMRLQCHRVSRTRALIYLPESHLGRRRPLEIPAQE